LAGIALLTILSLALAEHLELRMTWTDLLPADHSQVRLYREVQDRFGETSIVIALEGERDAIVTMAEQLEPELVRLQSLHNVLGRMPADFMLDHAFVLL
jgi:predicted RND superfamily exporter protein